MKKIIFAILLATFIILSFPSQIFAQSPGTEGQPCLTQGPRLCAPGFTNETKDGKCICKKFNLPTQAPQINIEKNSPGCVASNGQFGVRTAIGCIPVNSSDDLIGFFLRWGLGIIGGIAFLLILYAGFQIMTSRGDPKKLQAGQELLTSAIAGVIMLIFSVFILRVIGVDILGIIPR